MTSSQTLQRALPVGSAGGEPCSREQEDEEGDIADVQPSVAFGTKTSQLASGSAAVTMMSLLQDTAWRHAGCQSGRSSYRSSVQ